MKALHATANSNEDSDCDPDREDLNSLSNGSETSLQSNKDEDEAEDETVNRIVSVETVCDCLCTLFIFKTCCVGLHCELH